MADSDQGDSQPSGWRAGYLLAAAPWSLLVADLTESSLARRDSGGVEVHHIGRGASGFAGASIPFDHKRPETGMEVVRLGDCYSGLRTCFGYCTSVDLGVGVGVAGNGSSAFDHKRLVRRTERHSAGLPELLGQLGQPGQPGHVACSELQLVAVVVYLELAIWSMCSFSGSLEERMGQ